jgi:pleiotropic regulator 1
MVLAQRLAATGSLKVPVGATISVNGALATTRDTSDRLLTGGERKATLRITSGETAGEHVDRSMRLHPDEAEHVKDVIKHIASMGTAAAGMTIGPSGRTSNGPAPPAAPLSDKSALSIYRDADGRITDHSTTALIRLREERKVPKPKWHAPWKLMRVISGHLGWVRTVAVDPSNQWFATGAGDRIVKIWDLATGGLKLSLTGHIAAVRGIAISPRHPYLFSVGEDKMVKCWDLETNKVIRHYHGHLSGVYCVDVHPTLDVLVTGGRDSCVRVWDMRTKNQIHALTGHSNTVNTVKCQAAEPQIISGSADSTIKLWDMAAGKVMTTLTHHKKGVRAVATHPTQYSFASASPDAIKLWRCPRGDFLQNLSGHSSLINTMACNEDGVLFSGGDNGSMYFWDYLSGYNFQRAESTPQPGSLDAEAGILSSCFDMTGSRLITGEADKSIKMWREDPNATPDTHPLPQEWRPALRRSLH